MVKRLWVNRLPMFMALPPHPGRGSPWNLLQPDQVCGIALDEGLYAPALPAAGNFASEPLMREGSCTVLNGAEVDEVDEREFGPRAVVVFEFEAYPEPKVLTPSDLRALYSRYKSFNRVAEVIGASEAFARLNTAKERD